MIALLRRLWSLLLFPGAPAKRAGNIQGAIASEPGGQMEKQTHVTKKRTQDERETKLSASEIAHKERVRTAAARVTKNHADAIKRLADR